MIPRSVGAAFSRIRKRRNLARLVPKRYFFSESSFLLWLSIGRPLNEVRKRADVSTAARAKDENFVFACAPARFNCRTHAHQLFPAK